jgi:alginate O-acetyltransferase complex protein AlgJ
LSGLSRRALIAGSLAAGTAAFFGRRSAAAEVLVLVGRNGWLFPAWEHIGGMPEGETARSVSAIASLRGILERANVRLIVSLAPSKARVYPEDLPAKIVASAEFENRYRKILAAFKNAGIASPDVLSAMLAAKPQQQQYMMTDSHWTGYGAELAAGETAILAGAAEPASPPPAGIPVPAGWTELDVDGDLVPFLPQAQRAAYPREPLQVRQFDSGSALLTKDAPFSLAVIGNSFCNPVFGFPQTLSYRMQQPADLYWKYGSIGPWRCLAQYFAAKQQQKSPLPKTVVWQFSDYMLGSGPASAGAWGKDNAFASAADWLATVKRAISP